MAERDDASWSASRASEPPPSIFSDPTVVEDKEGDLGESNLVNGNVLPCKDDGGTHWQTQVAALR
eukprot:1387381-Karenia_brevis.AAC.1